MKEIEKNHCMSGNLKFFFFIWKKFEKFENKNNNIILFKENKNIIFYNNIESYNDCFMIVDFQFKLIIQK